MGDVFSAELKHRRAAAGLSLAGLASEVHVNRSYLHRVESGERWPTEPIARLLDQALNARGALFAAWQANDEERQEASVTAQRIAASRRASLDLDEYLHDLPLGEAVTAAETTTATLALQYLASPPGPMLSAALDARAAILASLRRAPSTAQRTDLIRVAGYLSGVLAYATLDLSHPDTAADHAATALRCAETSRDPELRAWVRGTQSLIARFDKQFDTALVLAEDGLRHPTTGTSTARLLAGVGQSAANLGDRAGAHRALNAANDAADKTDPSHDPFPGLFRFSRAKLSYYGGSAFMWLPERADARLAAQSAESAIDQWAAGDPADRSLDDEALARVYAATAYVKLRDLDAARAAIASVLVLPDERRISWLRRRVAEIPGLLGDPVFQHSNAAVTLAAAARAF